MKPTAFLFGLTCITLAGSPQARAGEAHASVYVVDRASEFAETGGACLPYSPQEKTAASREILGIAKGPAGATIFMMAFDRDSPHLGLAPIIAAQSEESKPIRFPAEGTSWPFDKFSRSVDLYVAVFDSADPELAKLAEYAEWLNDALKEKDEVNALLHAEAIQKRLSNLLRQRRVEDYRVRYGDEITSSRLPPSSKAAVTRGNKPDPLIDGDKRAPKSPVAAVRRGLKTLDGEWRQDARVIPFTVGNPGVLVFPITTPLAL
jgi:hypothetical protein